MGEDPPGMMEGGAEIPLYLAMGLETTDDFIREKCIRKGLTLTDFTEGQRRHTVPEPGSRPIC
jgi:hypothetical protein